MAPAKPLKDEEAPYEVSLNGEVSFEKYDMEPVLEGATLAKPQLGRRLTEVSRKYDRQGKGYLDSTERALRRMDSQNKGFLDIDKVYLIMESLQHEQRQSAELIEEIRKEHKKGVSLKRGLVALALFAVLLAVSNIGTSFAAARLAKDMRSSSTNDLVSTHDGQRLGTTSKTSEFTMSSQSTAAQHSSRRHLAALEQAACPKDASNTTVCSVYGYMVLADAVKLYKQFCPMWPNAANTCQGDGVPRAVLNCNGVRTTILGDEYIPSTGPERDTIGWEYYIFPNAQDTFSGKQVVRASNGWTPCTVDLQVSFYCETQDTTECIAFATFDTSQCAGAQPVLCGDYTDSTTAGNTTAAASTASKPVSGWGN